jgi:hypothetical protein
VSNENQDVGHTPGPWHADIYCVWAGGIYVAGTKTGLPVEQQIANARLIAAAPELLEALEAYTKMYDEVQPAGGWQGVYEDGLAAIAKAKGEQP